MIKKTFIVKDQDGLHARPSSLLTNVATKFTCNTDIEFKNKKNTLKSIMIVMSLGIAFQDEFTLITDGENEVEAFKALEDVLIQHQIV